MYRGVYTPQLTPDPYAMATAWFERGDSDDGHEAVPLVVAAPDAHPSHAADAAAAAAEHDFLVDEAIRAEEAGRRKKTRPRGGVKLTVRSFTAALDAVEWVDMDNGAMFMRAAPNPDRPREVSWIVMVPRLDEHFAKSLDVIRSAGRFAPAGLLAKAAEVGSTPTGMIGGVSRGTWGTRRLIHLATGEVHSLYVGDVNIPSKKLSACVGTTTIQSK